MRVIHIVEAEEEGVTHESKWATQTFQVRLACSDGTPGAAFNLMRGSAETPFEPLRPACAAVYPTTRFTMRPGT